MFVSILKQISKGIPGSNVINSQPAINNEENNTLSVDITVEGDSSIRMIELSSISSSRNDLSELLLQTDNDLDPKSARSVAELNTIDC